MFFLNPCSCTFWMAGVLGLMCSLTQCHDDKVQVDRSRSIDAHTTRIQYTLDAPDTVLTLPSSLNEISGLTSSSVYPFLFCVNDEAGRIYQLSKDNGAIEDIFVFGAGGDYEGIEMVGDTIYVVSSKGDIYLYDYARRFKGDIVKTILNSKNDVEGLAYDARSKKLILVNKGRSYAGRKSMSTQRGAYGFKTDILELDSLPFFVIDQEVLISAFNDSRVHLKEKVKLVKRLKQFAPSAIAVHPTEDAFYILSSPGKVLLAIHSYPDSMAIAFLEKSLFTQPEGICFDSDGTMYISNERRNRPSATLLKFTYKG